MSEQERPTVPRPGEREEPSWQTLLRGRLGDAEDVDQIIEAIEGSGEPDMTAHQVLERMAGDPVLRSAIAYADSVAMLQILGNKRGDGWDVDEERSGPIGEASVGVAWRYKAWHDWEPDYNPDRPNPELRALPPTGRPLEANGFSIFGIEKERFAVRRYVDWAGLYAQLGIGLNWRLPVDEMPVLRRQAAGPDAGASGPAGESINPPG